MEKNVRIILFFFSFSLEFSPRFLIVHPFPLRPIQLWKQVLPEEKGTIGFVSKRSKLSYPSKNPCLHIFLRLFYKRKKNSWLTYVCLAVVLWISKYLQRASSLGRSDTRTSSDICSSRKVLLEFIFGEVVKFLKQQSVFQQHWGGQKNTSEKVYTGDLTSCPPCIIQVEICLTRTRYLKLVSLSIGCNTLSTDSIQLVLFLF